MASRIKLYTPHRRTVLITRRFTGWQLVYGLRSEIYRQGFENQRDLGCLDAPTSLPGGALRVEQSPSNRFIHETGVLREGI